VLVFTRTKHGANRLAEQLDKDDISAMAIHGNKSQGARTRALAEFKSGKLQVLVATDIAARGIDISELPHVVNYELPNVPEDYVHRIGRTGRAGSEGEASSLVCVDELKLLKDIERLIKRELLKQVVPGFEVDPSIKPEPIPNGQNRGQGRPQQGRGQQSRGQQGQGQREERASSAPRAGRQPRAGQPQGRAGAPAQQKRSGSAQPAARPQGDRRGSGSSAPVPALQRLGRGR
jgi:ATP-dependent RNA helicase RhlE